MADTFGLKIGLEGEKEFKAQLKEIEQSFKVLGSEMKLVDSQFDKNDKSVGALTARNEVLQKSIDTQKNKIDTMRAALDNATKSFGENDARTKAWQIKLNEAQAELNKMEKELKENKAALNSEGDQLDDTRKKADKFGDEIEEAGDKSDDAGDKFSALKGVVAGVGVALAAAVAAVGAAAIKAGKALIQMSKDGAVYADNILTQSTVTGIATDKLQEYYYAVELVDVSVETLTGSMKKNIMAMKNAQAGSKTYTDAYAKLGISVTDANGNLRDSEEVYWELIEALGNVENETERDALAMTLLGKSAQELNPLIEAGSDRMKELAEEAHKAGYVMSDELLAAYGAFDDQMQYLNNGVTAAKNALGTILLPLLTDLASEGTSLLGEFTNGILEANGDLSKIGDVIGEVLPKALNVIIKYVPTILDLIKTVVISVGKAIIDNIDIIVDSVSEIIFEVLNSLVAALPKITEGAMRLVGSLVSGILDNLPMVLEAVIEATNTIVKGLGEALPKLIPVIVQAIENVVNTILNNLPLILDAILTVIKGLAKGILNALPILIKALPTVIKGIINFILEAIPMIIDAVIEIVNGIVDALPDIIQAIIEALPEIIQAIIDGVLEFIPMILECVMKIVFSIIENIPTIIDVLVNALPEIITSIINTLLSNIPKFIQTGFDLLVSLITNLPKIIIELVKAMPQIISSMVNSLMNGFGSFVEVGGNLLKGIWEGIKGMGSWLWDKVKGWANDFWNGFKNFFGIHSPSKKFMFLGDMMMEGLGKGIITNGKEVIKDARWIKEDLLKEFDNLDTGLDKVPTDYEINTNVPSVVPTIPSTTNNVVAGASGGAVTIEFHIDNFNNYSSDDIESLTEQILNTANAFITRKGVAY